VERIYKREKEVIVRKETTEINFQPESEVDQGRRSSNPGRRWALSSIGTGG
jgi:hypothetical protein